MTKKQFMHQNHPPSKIIVDPWKAFKKDSVDAEIVNERAKPEQAYRLFTKDIKVLNEKTPFKQYYSGGPVRRVHVSKVPFSLLATKQRSHDQSCVDYTEIL